VLFHELQELEMQNGELRRIQHELEISRSRYFDLYRFAPVGYLSLDDKGVIQDANLAAAAMLGVVLLDLLKKQITQFIFDEDRGAFYLPGKQACEIRMVRADGSIFWVSMQAAPERNGERGITLSDITERKLLEDALKESEATFRAHVENSFDVIFTLDAAGNFVFVSPAWERHFGYPVSEVIGKNFAPFVHPDDVQPCVEYLTQILGSGKSGTSPVYRVKCADGSLLSFVANGMPYTDTKGRILFIGVGHDVSEQLQAEQDRLDFERQLLHSQKLKSLGVLAGGIAHDFNNLLQAVLGNMELASMKLPPDSAPAKFIEHAIDAAKHAAGLTSQMLAYSGKGNFVIKKLDLNELVNNNVGMLRTAVSRAISMDLDTDAHLPPVMADEAQLQQVVMNLITNAAEAIEEQPGFIKLSTGVKDYDLAALAGSRLIDKPEPGRFVYLEVTDNGAGMNEDTQARIFDPFFTTKFTGRGLGMSAVLGIVKGHGGALFVESAPGSGSTITVIFPALESEKIPAAKESEISAEKGAAAEVPLSGTALVVDDEKNVLRIAVAIVKHCGFSVIFAHDGVDAINKFREHAEEIDVVLMDLTMPNMDGVAAMDKLRLIKPDAKIILTSGFNELELDERISGPLPSGFIRKPYSLKEVEAELRRVFQENKS
jgi:two-component system cell cycle sensor histidine kinase/response regulator CckA